MFKLTNRNLLFTTLLATVALVNISVAQSPSNSATSPQAKSPATLVGAKAMKTIGTSRRIPEKMPEPNLSVGTHERFATFLADDGFESELLLQNNRLDTQVVARPAFIIGDKEVALEPVTLAPHDAQTVDLNSQLGRLGLGPSRGAVVVRYDFSTYAAVGAVVIASNRTKGLYLIFSGQSGEEFWVGNSSDAAIWAPDKDTEGFISAINTYTEPIRARMTFTVKGRNPEVREFDIAPHRQEIVKIDSLVRRSVEAGAGIHLEFTGDPGGIIAEGTLLNRRTGFAKHIHFTDKALKFATQSLRTHFLLVGSQPAEDNFPSQINFRSVAVIRNIDAAPVAVTPVIKYLKNGLLRKVTLQPMQLDVNETRLLDFSQERSLGHLPSDLSQASVELVPNTDHTSIISELVNFDARTGGYVVGPSFGAHPMRSTSSIWRTDARYETTIMIENTAADDDQVSLKLFSEAGTFEKIIDIPSGGLVKVNLNELQQKGVRDKDGKLLTATSGTLHLSGSHGGRSALAFDKLIYSTDVSEYVGLPAQPCDYVQDFEGSLDGGGNPYTPTITEFWTDGTDDTFAAFPTSSNNSLVEVTSDSFGDPLVIVNGSPDGQPHTVTLDFTDTILDCTACSTRQADRLLSVSVPACPTSISVNGLTNIPLENGFAQGLRTGIGAVATMVVGPATGNFNQVPITESVSTNFVLQQTCAEPPFPTNMCSGSDTFIVGDGGSDFGVNKFPAANTFYDFHETGDTRNLLVVANQNSCTVGCSQTYSCNGRLIGSFTIIRNFTKDTIQGTPVTRVTVSKQ